MAIYGAQHGKVLVAANVEQHYGGDSHLAQFLIPRRYPLTRMPSICKYCFMSSMEKP